ncbi:MAG: hypothetical protein AAB691_03610 [Patescibacteria group bacterium]
MVQKDLADYIKTEFSRGASEEGIKKNLLAAGWAAADIEEGLQAFRPKPAVTASPLPSIQVGVPQTATQTTSTILPSQPSTTSPVTVTTPSISTNSTIVATSTVGKSLPKKKFPVVIIAIVIFVIALGGVGFVYGKNIVSFFKSPIDESQVLNTLFMRLSTMESAKYAANLEILSEPRDKDAEPFSPIVNAEQPKYDRDVNRFRDLTNIRTKLRDAFTKNKIYPISLAAAGILFKDPLGQPYEYVATDNGTNFSLKMTFETPEAITALAPPYGRNNPKVDEKTATFTKAQASSYYYYTGKPNQPTLVNLLSSQNEYLNYLPENLSFIIKASGTASRAADSPDVRLQVGTDINFEDFIINADLEFVKKGEDFYINVHKLPGFFSGLTKIKSTWIKMTGSDLTQTGGSYFYGLNKIADLENEVERKKLMERSQTLSKLILEEKVLALSGSGTKEKINGQDATRYQLRVVKENLIAFYEKALTEFKNKFGATSTTEFDQATLEFLKGPSFNAVFAYLEKNTSLTVWIDPKTGDPLKTTYSIRLVPGNGALDDQQLRLTFNLELEDINEGIQVDAPKDAISFDEAQMKLSGLSREQFLLQRAKASVSSVRSALLSYKSIMLKYPTSLDELKKTRKELQAVAPKKPTASTSNISMGMAINEDLDYLDYYDRYDNQPLLKTIPLDPTGKPFGYKPQGADFALTYDILIPPYVTGTNPTYIYSYAYGEDYYSLDYQTRLKTTPQRMIQEFYVHGKNTATSKVLSEEALRQSKVDSDKDGVSDWFEGYIGTNKNKADTDGDAYSDSEELGRGDNPNGAGKLKSVGTDYGSFFF